MARGRVNTRLLMALMMLLGVVSNGVPAAATGYSSLNGLFWTDLNQTGKLGDTDAAQLGAKPEGPLAGVAIEISGPSGMLTQTTGPDGTYRFDGLVTGSHSIVVTYPLGYQPGTTGPDSNLGGDVVAASGKPWAIHATVFVEPSTGIVLNGAV